MQSLMEKILHKLNYASPSKPQSVFRTIIVPMIILVIVEVILLISVLAGTNVLQRLNRNSEDLILKQLQNRANYFSSALYNWSDLDVLASTINSKAESMISDSTINIDELQSDSNVSTPLVMDIVDDLISTLYSKRLSGIYVVFNTTNINDIPKMKTIPNRTGIYIRDMDPTSTPSERYEDLLLCRASVQVVQGLNISTDSCWKPQFTFTEDKDTPENFAYFTEPIKAAFKSGGVNDACDYGYWGGSAHLLVDSDITAITYSIPLVLSDGTIYGVLGIDIADDYLLSLLPYTELYDDNVGTYFVIKQKSSVNSLKIVTPILWNGEQFSKSKEVSLSLSRANDGYSFKYKGESYFASAVPIYLYSNNSPFENDYWAILGAVPAKNIYQFSNHMVSLLVLDVIFMFIAGIIGSIIISRRFSAPIKRLSGEISEARKVSGIPSLSVTGIKELDRFANDFKYLCQEVVGTSTRFLQIIQLASVELGGFEIRKDINTVYVTDNYFKMLGMNDVNADDITVGQFLKLNSELKSSLTGLNEPDGSVLYKVEPVPGAVRYIRINVTDTETRLVGVAEDVTMATLERFMIQHERDYDMLTGLISRRAFYDRAEELFADKEKMCYAALMMLDLDNLKTINDHYGHDYGDKYIHQAAASFAEHAPAGAICSRVSGDEFFILFYGYKELDSLKKAVNKFSADIKTNIFELPTGETTLISASGGVAWYPGDSSDFWQLMKYADFAMYKAKNGRKGKVENFDMDVYNRESFMLNSRQDFFKLIMEERLIYHFQPIFSSKDGSVAAYESLMRSDLPTLRSPANILEIAREEKRLQDIEDLTWLKALQRYKELLAMNKIDEKAYLFVNSFASQIMSKRAQDKFNYEYFCFKDSIVTEITEFEDLDSEIMEKKKALAGENCLFALDDYGSGYNGELNLLELSPKFIKVDISIIRDIDTDIDKQRIVSNIVDYAHDRDMFIIAEGIETPSELTKVLDLGVDLLQGYILARPAAIPDNISKTALDIIKNFNAQ